MKLYVVCRNPHSPLGQHWKRPDVPSGQSWDSGQSGGGIHSQAGCQKACISLRWTETGQCAWSIHGGRAVASAGGQEGGERRRRVQVSATDVRQRRTDWRTDATATGHTLVSQSITVVISSRSETRLSPINRTYNVARRCT